MEPPTFTIKLRARAFERLFGTAEAEEPAAAPLFAEAALLAALAAALVDSLGPAAGLVLCAGAVVGTRTQTDKKKGVLPGLAMLPSAAAAVACALEAGGLGAAAAWAAALVFCAWALPAAFGFGRLGAVSAALAEAREAAFVDAASQSLFAYVDLPVDEAKARRAASRAELVELARAAGADDPKFWRSRRDGRRILCSMIQGRRFEALAFVAPAAAAAGLLGPDPANPALFPVEFAASKGHAPTVGLLARLAPGELESRGADGSRPIDRAASAGRAEAVKALAGAGATLEAADEGSASPLARACMAGCAAAALALVELGADPRRRSPDPQAAGYSAALEKMEPSEYARIAGNSELADRIAALAERMEIDEALAEDFLGLPALPARAASRTARL